jgi:hypothetical protein
MSKILLTKVVTRRKVISWGTYVVNIFWIQILKGRLGYTSFHILILDISTLCKVFGYYFFDMLHTLELLMKKRNSYIDYFGIKKNADTTNR